MSRLSGLHDPNAAGLPRGSNHLSPCETREMQRRRILRAAITVFAQRGYASATIADIVSGARVSRQVFYALFETKEDCFLAAEALGRHVLFASLTHALDHEDCSADGWMRVVVRNYLRICAEEPDFARAWTIEFPNATPQTLLRRNEFFNQLTQILRENHLRAQEKNPNDWPKVPDFFYQAAIGAAHELIYQLISQHEYSKLPLLEDQIMEFMHTVFSYKTAAVF